MERQNMGNSGLGAPPSWEHGDRFLDLLDAVSDEEAGEDGIGELPQMKPSGEKGLARQAGEDGIGELPQMKPSGEKGLARQESSHGPWHWNSRCSADLQQVVDSFCFEEFYESGFSVTIADPMQPDCPLVACSTGFTELTGYSVQEIVGRNCRFLLHGVPSSEIDEQARMRCRAYCSSCLSGEEYNGKVDNLPDDIAKPWVELPKGELICVQTNSRKSGELFRNMFYLKQVELDDATFILGLQAGLPEELDTDNSMADLGRVCKQAFNILEANMTMIEQVLAQQFWYSAPMRRQN